LRTAAEKQERTLTVSRSLTTQSFYRAGLVTVLVDLFSSEEQALDEQTKYFRTNIDIMQQRIIGVANC